jgi:hypothetical protein
MRVLIKKPNTNEFYKGDGEWSDDRDQAKNFDNSVDALRECDHWQLYGEIVLSFRNPRFDVKIPVNQNATRNA